LSEKNRIENIFSFLPLNKNYLITVSQVGLKPKFIFLEDDQKTISIFSKIVNDLDGFEGDFSPVSQFNGDIIWDSLVLFKKSK
jgi:hypothetical protein